MYVFAQTMIIGIFLIPAHIYAATILKGNATNTNDTFLFRVQQHVQSPELPTNQSPQAVRLLGLNFYTAAHPDDGGNGNINQYAVAQITRGSDQFIGLTPQKVKYNGADNVENPLYDKGISYLSILDGSQTFFAGTILAGASERPVVVHASDLMTIYIINNFRPDGTGVEVISIINQGNMTQNIPDANGAVTSGIKNIHADTPFVVAAVAPNGGTFGDDGTGLAVAIIQSTGEKVAAPLIIDAPTFTTNYSGGNRAAAFSRTSDFIKITSDLAAMTDVVDIEFFPELNRWYIALQVTGAGGGTDGARSIIIGRVVYSLVEFEQNTQKVNKFIPTSFEFDPIAPADVFDGTDKIVGAVGASSEISAHKVRRLFTSTALPYLIVQGNVGTPADTKRTVFALPLVSGLQDTNSNDSATNGTIASKTATPEGLFTTDTRHLFRTYNVKTAATTSAQMPLATDTATQVGGGTLVNGDITDMFTNGDAVFVSVESADGSQLPGLFHSQAMLDENGQIKGWTKWKRVAGNTNHIFAAGLDCNTADLYTMVATTTEVKTVKRTDWSDGVTLALLSTVAQALWPESNGGVQGLFDFVITSTTAGTETPGLYDISLLIATGNNGILMAQTSNDISGVVTPTTSFGTPINFTNGAIDQTFPVSDTKLITIQGDVLSDLGPIAAAEIARDGTAGLNGYLFVGGTNGVAVLSKSDGSGWDATTGLADGFTGLTAGMTFKKIDYAYTNVRKLIADGDFLYVLTRTEFHRIDLTASNVGLGTIAPTILARTTELLGSAGSFLDAIVSEQTALLATSEGLLRNVINIQTALSNDSVGWSMLATPEGIGAVRQLFAVSATGRAQDVAKSPSGYIYALNAFVGKDQAYLFRYAVSGLAVSKIPDLFVEDIPSYFVGFGQFRNIFITDGALYIASRSKTQTTSPVVISLNSTVGIKTGSRFPSTILLPTGVQGTLVTALVKNSASGSWIVAGDSGLRINE